MPGRQSRNRGEGAETEDEEEARVFTEAQNKLSGEIMTDKQPPGSSLRL